MSIPVPAKKVAPIDGEERKWLRRVRGATLCQMADQANQLASRVGLVSFTKTFNYTFNRFDKTGNGNGFLWHEPGLAGSSQLDYYVDMPYKSPTATSLALIVTYMAPNDLANDIVNAGNYGTFGPVGQSELRVRLLDHSGQTVDPTIASGATWACVLSGAEMPNPRVVQRDINYWEREDGSGGVELASSGGVDYGYSARVLRSIFYLDRGPIPSSSGITAARRLVYGLAAGTDNGLTVHLRIAHGAVLEVTVFEVPQLVVG